MNQQSTLSASIQSAIKLVGSVADKYVIKGSIQQYIYLKGSVVTFVTNLSIKALIYMYAEVDALSMVHRNIIKTITSTSYVYCKSMINKNAKALISPTAQMLARAMGKKNIILTIYSTPCVGKNRILSEADPYAFSMIDSDFLATLDFSEGVLMVVEKRAKVLLTSVSNVVGTLSMIKYTKLSDMDSHTLAYYDSSTLGAIQEIAV
jgi:hypothetical protein